MEKLTIKDLFFPALRNRMNLQPPERRKAQRLANRIDPLRCTFSKFLIMFADVKTKREMLALYSALCCFPGEYQDILMVTSIYQIRVHDILFN